MNHIPFLLIQDNKVTGTTTTDRKPMYENDMCRASGLIAACNCCDRIIFEDENDLNSYQDSGGYCSWCRDAD
jgi:hypothetical protein